MPDQNSPPPALAPPPEGIYRTFEELLTSIQRVAKDNGYGVVKLRASNYRDGKPTRYDLVCDRGGVKYTSTAKKRNPSTRKIDCPWRAKAVCEVQLGYQWRFAVQEPRHNHEPRLPSQQMPIPTPQPAQAVVAAGQQDNTNANNGAININTIRSLNLKLDRIVHDLTNGFIRMEATMAQLDKRLDNIEGRLAGGYEPRLDNLENRVTNYERGLHNIDARLQNMETRDIRDMNIPTMDDVETSRLLANAVM